VGVERDPETLIKYQTIYSPENDPDEKDESKKVWFTIRKADNAADIARSNMFSKVRFVDEEGGIAQERDLPMGDMEIGTIALCLTDWNFDYKGSKVPVTRANIVRFLTIRERKFVYQEIMNLNPLWSGREEEKND
jgi:hypothetical protein